MTMNTTDVTKKTPEKKEKKKARETRPFSTKLGDYFNAAPGFDSFRAKLDKRRSRRNRFKSSDRTTQETMSRGK